ncbi:MAG: 3-deoxy-7-phosphoheptulonate synthase [Armatimonadetes bacterium]|nr:3-deoxy-7-phosphoheptulonate synthase [Armatimonadota bacterium]
MEGETLSGALPLPTPRELLAMYPPSEAARQTVERGRSDIRRILRGEDDRLMVIVGPCSIHAPDEGLEYAAKLAALNRELSDKLAIVMRVYVEKPRTTVGWRGMLNDPRMDGSFDMAEGLRVVRHLFTTVSEWGLPVATEPLDPLAPAFLGDLVAFAGIGARTTESQPHRAMASGMPYPVGFKNGTSGSITVAVEAMLSARGRHSFFSVDDAGRCCLKRTEGNPDTVLILRGGKVVDAQSGAKGRYVGNYDFASVSAAGRELSDGGLPPAMVVDCSHANSGYDPRNQLIVCESVARQRAETREAQVTGGGRIIGVMLESYLEEGKQKLPDRPQDLPGLRRGVSVTDACLGWDDTETLLRRLADT